LRAEKPGGGAYTLLIERGKLVATEIHAAADFADKLQRHQTIRLYPKI